MIVSAAGGVLAGAALTSIVLPSVVTGAILGAIAGAVMSFCFRFYLDR